MTKARNGFWHSFYFTTGAFHEPIDHVREGQVSLRPLAASARTAAR